jgi:hypothetical protein
MIRGRITSLLVDHQLGYLRAEEPAAHRDACFHKSVLVGCRFEQLAVDQIVWYDPEETRRGRRCPRCRRVDVTEPA